VFVDWRIEFHSDTLAAMQGGSGTTSDTLLRGVERIYREAGVPEHLHQSGGLNYLCQMIEAQATMFAFQDGFWLLFASYLSGVIPAIFLGIEYNKLKNRRR